MEFLGRLVALAVGAEGDDQPGDEGGPRSGKGLEDHGVFMLGHDLGDGGVVLQNRANEGLDQSGRGIGPASCEVR